MENKEIEAGQHDHKIMRLIIDALIAIRTHKMYT